MAIDHPSDGRFIDPSEDEIVRAFVLDPPSPDCGFPEQGPENDPEVPIPGCTDNSGYLFAVEDEIWVDCEEG